LCVVPLSRHTVRATFLQKAVKKLAALTTCLHLLCQKFL
jgi:hypothetical protein